MNSIRKLFKTRIMSEAAWSLFGQIGSGIVLLLGTRIITELVSPEIYGQVALVVGIVTFGVGVFSYPLINAGMRLLPDLLKSGQRTELRQTLAQLIMRSMTIALLMIAIVGVGHSYFYNGNPWLFPLAGMLLLVTTRRELETQLLIAERRQREASLWQSGDSVARPLLAIALVLWGGASPTLILLGYTLASAAINGLGLRLHGMCASNRIRTPPTHNLGIRSDVGAYAWPLVPLAIMAWFIGVGDRYVIGYFMTAADVGLYAAAYTLVMEAFNRSAMVLVRTFQPVYFQHWSAGNKKHALKVFAIWLSCVFAVGISGTLALSWLKDWVSSLLLAETYRSAAALMPVIGLGCAFQQLANVLAQPLYAAKRTKSVLCGRICGAVTAAVVMPLMVKHAGLMGAAAAAPIYFGTEALILAIMAKPWSVFHRIFSRTDSLMLRLTHSSTQENDA
jgi:O-antigen/teichoic acid export membrane protein